MLCLISGIVCTPPYHRHPKCPSPNLRSSILAEFHGQVLRLLLHREASPIIAEAYELYANATERDRLLVDLLGKEVSLFQIPSSVKPESAKEAQSQSRGLKAALQNVDAERKKRVLLALKENLINMCVDTAVSNSFQVILLTVPKLSVASIILIKAPSLTR